MKNKTIHIVSFSVPFPANYGGVIDIFYKIKAFNKVGVDVILHCFKYDREVAPELLKYCKEVHYYKRKMNPLLLLASEPFIVATRKSEDLVKCLAKDDFPILLEGLHTCGMLNHSALKGRKIIVRSHNIEHHYYEQLAVSERSFLKRLYFKMESKKLLKFEKQAFPLVDEILGISSKDTQYLQKNYNKGMHVSAFHQFENVSIETKNSTDKKYAFYHGNLAINENNDAALYLIEKVFSNTNFPLVIAGNSPSQQLIDACSKAKNVSLKANITSKEILGFLQNAHINVLPTFQNTGIKLKLLASLFGGKHCLVNSPMVEGTGLESICIIKDEPTEMAHEIEALIEKNFTDQEIENRKLVLHKFSNANAIGKTCELIWS